jgi:hypothetical protein
MKQKLYNALDMNLERAKTRLARRIVAEAKAAGFKLKDPSHRATIKQLADMSYHITMAILEAEEQ